MRSQTSVASRYRRISATLLQQSLRGLFALTFGAALSGTVAQAQVPGLPNNLRVAAASTAAETGLILSLAHRFEALHPGISVQIEYAGAIAVLDRAREGRADFVITHHPESEALFVGDGFGTLRTSFMYNEFAFFGPAKDPLHLQRETDIRAVLRRLAKEQVSFMAPGQRSGTYKKLSELWALIGMEPNWPGYEVTGESSAATLRAAALFDAYAFADLGTYLAYRSELSNKLIPLVRDNVVLRNYYSAIVVDRERVSSANQRVAEQFLEFLVSVDGQEHIRKFGTDRLGAQIFVPSAHLDEGLRVRRTLAELEDKSANLRRLAILAIVLVIVAVVTVLLFIRGRRLGRDARRSEERFVLAIAGANDGIWDWDFAHDKIYLSPRLRQILNYAQDDTPVPAPRTLFAEQVHADDRKRVLEEIENYLGDRGGELFETECRWRNDTDRYRWVLIRGKALRDADGSPTRMSGSMTDITQRKAQEDALLHQALYDALTNLPNRTLLLDRTGQAIRVAERTKRTVALIVLGLDRFKDINDSLGYDVGDLILKEIGVRLGKALRGSDTVARLSGDEFGVLLPDIAGELYVQHVAKKIAVVLARPVDLEQHALHIAASVGIALYPQHGEDAEQLIQRADVAMYTAKRTASGCVVYDAEQDRGSSRRLSLANDLHDALDRDALNLHFQPKIDLRTGAPTGVEALLRWEHPTQGPIRPDEVIPIAEQTGLIKPLTLWVLDAALQQRVEWEKQGIHLSVAVNLSMWSLQDPKLTQQVQDALDRWKVPPNQLELEITESAMMADPKRSLEILTQLHEMGVGLSVDDYGTGFSSLAYLKRLPVDVMKIDRSFVMNMDLDEGNGVIVRSTIELAHNLGLAVVAEGVENKAISDRLVELDCDTAQGYYYCRPNTAEVITHWLRESPWGAAMQRRASLH